MGYLRDLARRVLKYPTASAFNDLNTTHDNQSTAANIRLDRPTKDVTERLEQIDDRLAHFQTSSTGSERTPKTDAETARNLNADASAGIATDLELIERFSHDWQANAHAYPQMLNNLREASRRLLPILTSTETQHSKISNEIVHRLRSVEDQIACLARQPLYFTEMFHGVKLLPNGESQPLSHLEEVHLRANGLLGIEDRRAVRKIYERLLKTANSNLRVLEIGSAAGRGSTRIAGEYVKKSNGVLYCVDVWTYASYFAFLANMRIFDLETTVFPVRSPSVEAAKLFDDGTLDAVFVDGSHIYPDVVADIDAYLPKIRKGGFMFGHDLHDVPSRFDRAELLGVAEMNNTEANYTNSNGEIERVDVHPGVILAVQDRFGDDVELVEPGSVVWAKQI